MTEPEANSKGRPGPERYQADPGGPRAGSGALVARATGPAPPPASGARAAVQVGATRARRPGAGARPGRQAGQSRVWASALQRPSDPSDLSALLPPTTRRRAPAEVHTSCQSTGWISGEATEAPTNSTNHASMERAKS